MDKLSTSAFHNLSRVELLGIADICAQLHDYSPETSFLKHSYDILKEAFGHVIFGTELYQQDPVAILEQEIFAVPDQLLPIQMNHFHEHPYAEKATQQKGAYIGLLEAEEKYEIFKHSTLHNEFYEKLDAQHHMWIGLSSNNQLFSCFYGRDKAYTEHERAMLHLIEPHLDLAWRHWQETRSLNKELSRLKESMELDQDDAIFPFRQALDALPARQQEVIERVADGMDNQQIADELHISKRTVQKHLENIFQTLEVHHRTELAAKWHKAHSIQLY
ncbi:helix-turn-helix transcriptional regulator [Pontiellaceae bacterium B1224]|nr:helix-turn-helix transcriptional regulator [Pontiellaceae bacterium B1224]